MTSSRKPYHSDVSDEEWAVVAPYLTLLLGEARQREHSLREVFNDLRDIIKNGRTLALNAQQSATLGRHLSAGGALERFGVERNRKI